MTPVMPLMGFMTAAIHRQTALGAKLRSLRVHAGGNFWHVRNELRTQAHCIRRASLTGIDHLSTCALKAKQHEHTERQCQAARQTPESHFIVPPATRHARGSAKLAPIVTGVDGYLG